MCMSCIINCTCWNHRRLPKAYHQRRLITVTMSADDVTRGFDDLQGARNERLGIRRIRFVSASLQRDQQLRSSWDIFWRNLGPEIWELSFDSCDISERSFCEILLKLCPNTNSLTLNNCNSLFMSGKLLDATTISQSPNGPHTVSTTTLRNIIELNLKNNPYLSDALFNRFISFTTNVTRLSLAGCQISFHPAIYKRFYPASQSPSSPSESVLTFENVFKFLEHQSSKLIGLDLSKTLVDDNALKKLSTLVELQLEELLLFNCQEVSAIGIETVCAHQPHLRILDVSKCSRLSDGALIAISRHLKQLLHLNIQKCFGFTANGIAELVKLSRVDINIENTAATHLVKLNLSYCDLTECAIITLSQSSALTSSLRHLDLSNCCKGVTDNSLQSICSNFRWLRCLKLASCNAITDAAFFGSRDEVTDTRCLSDIFGLRKLDLSACTQITDEGFCRLRFQELVSLNVSKCDRLSDVGLVSIGAQCNGSVEKILLSECRDITDIGVVALIKCLPRLKYLDLQGCKKIGQPTLDALQQWCSELRYVDMTMCPRVTSESAQCLESTMPRLHIEIRHMQLMLLDERELWFYNRSY